MAKKFHRGGGFSVAGMFCLYAWVLLLALHTVGTDADLYFRLQMKAEILPSAGITADELKAADTALADYLRGDASALDSSLFNETEIAHMRDCYDLFAMLRRVLTVLFGLAVFFLIVGRGRRLRRASRIAAVILLALIGGLAAWGIADFDSLFTAFHRLLFSNDLWLLDPKTDLLIRICPESMFAEMAGIVGGIAAAFVGFCILMTSLGEKYYARKL